MKMFTSLHSKLFFTYLLIGVLPLFFFLSAAISSLEEFYREDLRGDIEFLASRTATHISAQNFLLDDARREAFYESFQNHVEGAPNARVLLVDKEGAVMFFSHDDEIGSSWVNEIIYGVLMGAEVAPFSISEEELAFVAPIMHNETIVGAVYVIKNNEEDGAVTQNNIITFTEHLAGLASIYEYMLNDARRDTFIDDVFRLSNEIADTRVLVVNDGGTVINDSLGTEIGRPLVIPEVLNALNGVAMQADFIDDTRMAFAAPIMYGEVIVGAVLVETSVEFLREISARFQGNFIRLMFLISAIVVPLVWFTARLLVNPLRKIVKTVQVISDGQLNERIEVRSNDEFGELRDAFNQMTAQLEKIDANRQEFVSNVSHELRTPLSAIKVLSDSLLTNETADIESYKEFMLDISSEVDRLNNIVNELLTLVSLEQGEPSLNITKFSVNKMVVDILKRLYPLAEIKIIELLLEDVKQITLEGDTMKLSIAISNLIENGIKYTPEQGTVKVIIDSDHQHAFITVQDTGIGINEQDQAKVFTRFYRADKTRSRDTGGTGLGLSITHKTVLLHHGSIRITSKENEGTSFMVRLPLKQEQ